jgi:hypothetical protein
LKKRLQEIAEYLNNGDWTLASSLIGTLGIDYEKLFAEKLGSELNRKREKIRKKYRCFDIYYAIPNCFKEKKNRAFLKCLSHASITFYFRTC